MTRPNFTTSIVVDQPAITVFNAINNVRAWWSEEITGVTDELNAVWNYHYQDVHRCKIKITELVPAQKVVWEVLDNYFSFTEDKNEWIGNTMVFEITPKDNQTQLKVTQMGLTDEYECYDICSNAWTTYVQKSLYNLITTGTGQPNGKENPQTEDEKRLASPNFTATIFVDQSPEEVYNAINNVRGWWQGEVTGTTDTLSKEFDYRMKDIHFSKQQVAELVPFEKIVWNVTDSNLSSFEDPSEWTGTKVIFEIKEINNKTQVRFTHIGLVPDFQCYDDCSWAWGQLIKESLSSLITNGKGVNVFG
jgi:hypothetical protein